MKNLKKVLALVMAFAMAFTMMAGAAYTDQDDIQATDAVELLATLNVMTGKGDGMFHPNDTITRAEICRIIYTIRNEGNDNANAYADMQTSFQDLTSADDWAKGYIKHCQSVGLISGRNEAGTVFGPQDPVTGVELAVICLRVLGYDPAKAGIGGESWSTKTIGLASEAGLLKGVNMESVTGPCERQWAAQIMANMLDARTVRWSADGDRYTTYAEDGKDNPTVGKEYMKLWSSVGTLISVSGGNLAIDQNKSDIADSDPNEDCITSFTNVDKDYTELLGQKVKVLFSDGKANKVIGVYALTGNTVYTVNATAVESDDNKVKFDGKSYAIEYITTGGTKRINDSIKAAYVTANGNEYDSKDGAIRSQAGFEYTPAGEYDQFESYLFDNWDTSSAIMKFVDSDDNGRLDSVIITDYAAAEVTSATSTKIVAGKTYNYSDENIDENITDGDWVSISYNRFDDCLDIKKIDATTGKLEGIKNDSLTAGSDSNLATNSSKIPADKRDGKKLKYNEYHVDSAWFNDATDIDNHTDISTVKASDDISYIMLNGVAWKMKRANAASLNNVVDVAMVVNKDDGINGKQVKLQFFNDTDAVVPVDTYDTNDATGRVSWKDLETGTLYEYSISGGKYIFEELDPIKDFYGDYTYEGKHQYDFGSPSSATAINNKTIDDTAKVILFAGARAKADGTKYTTDVLTGKQLKALKAAQVTNPDKSSLSDTAAEYFTADVSGLNRAAAIAIRVEELPAVTASNDYYGYITSDAYASDRENEITYELLLETGDTVRVYERSTRPAERKENTLIGYKSLADEDSNGKRYIDDVKPYSLAAGSENFGIGAISSDSQSTVVLDGYGKQYNKQTTGAQHVDLDVTNNTVVFYVDSDGVSGSTTGSITKAMTYTDQTPAAVITADDGTLKVANCMYLAKDGSDYEVLVIDINKQLRGPDVDYYTTNTSALSLTASATSVPMNTASVEFTLKARSDFADTGKNVTVSVTPTLTGATMPTTLTIKSGESKNFTLTTSSAAVGTYTVTATADGKTASTTFTITGTPIAATEINKLTISGDWSSNTPDFLADHPNTAFTVATTSTVYDTPVVTINGVAQDQVTDMAVGNMNVVVTLEPKANNMFELTDAIKDALVLPTLCNVPGVPSINNGKLEITYTIPVAAVNATSDKGTLISQLAAKKDVTFTGTTLSDPVTVQGGTTLTLQNGINDITKITTTDGGTVLLKDDATVASISALGNMTGSAKANANTTDATPVDMKTNVSNALKIKADASAKMLGFDSTNTLAALAADANNSAYLNPVQIKIPAAQVSNKYIKIERTFDGTTWSAPFSATTGLSDGSFQNDTTDFEFNGLIGEKVTGIRFLVADAAFTSSTTPTAVYTFTLR